jgi:hypothetical protein
MYFDCYFRMCFWIQKIELKLKNAKVIRSGLLIKAESEDFNNKKIIKMLIE